MTNEITTNEFKNRIECLAIIESMRMNNNCAERELKCFGEWSTDHPEYHEELQNRLSELLLTMKNIK